MKRILIALSVLLFAAVAVPAAAEQGKKGKHKGQGPEVIQLPQGFGPEGITTTKRHTFLVGSRESGAIYKGSLRTGEGDFLVDPDPSPTGFRATGMKVDKRGRLFVAGANSDRIRVYDVRDGDLLANYGVDAGFINDVILTRRGAYFTDSQVQELYFIPFERRGELGELVEIPITGMTYTAGQFNLNGIEAAKGGKTLIAVNSFTGELFTIDVRNGGAAAKAIDLGDGNVQRGDGILLKGRTLYVVQNSLNLVTPVKLSRDLEEGDIQDSITSPLFNVPTTIAKSGGRLYVVNAKFGANSPTQTYEVVRVPKK
jgi:sugar lactone lactonase YvrE